MTGYAARHVRDTEAAAIGGIAALQC
jgi:hypothetical protein